VRLTASLAGMEEVAGGVQELIDCLVEIDGRTKPACAAQDKASSSSLLHLFVAGSRSDGQEKVQPS
jgi:hypothetical protein